MTTGHELSWLPEEDAFASLGDEVHIWLLSIDLLLNEVRSLFNTLSEDERERAESFRFIRHRNRFIVSHAVLRVLAGHYLHVEPARLRFDYGRFGKPSLNARHHPDADLSFNQTHSEDLALCAFVRHSAIGIDCESIHQLKDVEAIVQRFFSRHEIETFHWLSEEEKTVAFFNCWTRKEAYIKALGSGLSMPLDRFTVSMRVDEPPRLLRVDGMPDESLRWTLKSWEPAPGYIAAAAIEGPVRKMRHFTLPAGK